MKVKCKVCGGWFEKDNIYCDYCAAKIGTERSQYDIDLFEDQRSFSKEEQVKRSKKQEQKNTKDHNTEGTPSKLPDLDTLRDLRPQSSNKNTTGKRKKNIETIKVIGLVLVLINIIAGIFDISDFIGSSTSDNFSFYEDSISNDSTSIITEEVVPIHSDFPENPHYDYSGTYSLISQQPEGIYLGTLSTETYLNFDTKEMRIDLKDQDYSGIYATNILITISKTGDKDAYYMDLWDENTLKMLGSYLLPIETFTGTTGPLAGDPAQKFYDDTDMTDLNGEFFDTLLNGRLALPYTVDNEVNYFDFSVEKINDDTTPIFKRSYLENEYLEEFMNDDASLSIDFYTHGEEQGYPHSSMYYQGVFVLSDGDNAYPPMPFYLSDDGQIYAYMEQLDTDILAIRDADMDNYFYFDDVDTQFYRYYPKKSADVLYSFELTGEIFKEDGITKIKGDYEITHQKNGTDTIYQDFIVDYTGID